jgi:hypothetical protein
MTDYTRASTYGGASEPGTTRGPAEIESEINRTRDRMGEEIEAIGEKLRPERIKQRAKEAVSRKTRETGASMVRIARENPIPAAMVALGMTLLLRARGKRREWGNGYSSESSSGGRTSEGVGAAVEGVKDKAQEFAGRAGEKVEHVAGQAAEKAKRTGSQLQQFFEGNPVIAGAAVMVLGAAIGALLPETEKENRIMGPARDELVDQAKSVAQHAQGTLEEKMSESPSSNPPPQSQSWSGPGGRGERYGGQPQQ